MIDSVHHILKPCGIIDTDFSILLIDFGCATKYIDKAGKHLFQDEVDGFDGSITFASINHMNMV